MCIHLLLKGLSGEKEKGENRKEKKRKEKKETRREGRERKELYIVKQMADGSHGGVRSNLEWTIHFVIPLFYQQEKKRKENKTKTETKYKKKEKEKEAERNIKK